MRRPPDGISNVKFQILDFRLQISDSPFAERTATNRPSAGSPNVQIQMTNGANALFNDQHSEFRNPHSAIDIEPARTEPRPPNIADSAFRIEPARTEPRPPRFAAGLQFRTPYSSTNYRKSQKTCVFSDANCDIDLADNLRQLFGPTSCFAIGDSS